ncbi:MAG TPA: DUF4123 domain-containing protein [Flavipsychrobacter sp.]|nr:DUF4123 domain-containing protein [Flavipsychrobacter sp.]
MRYLCFDTALNEVYTLLLLQKEYPSYLSLFHGTKNEAIWHVAPWLIAITNENFYKKWNDPNCHLERCLIIESSAHIKDLKLHLQQFIYKKVNQSDHFNRFWDAKVLLQQLERMSSEERLHFFEEIEAIYLEDYDGFLKMSLDRKARLVKENVTEQQLFSPADRVATTMEQLPEQQTKPEIKPRRRFFTD